MDTRLRHRPKGKPVIAHACCNPAWPLVVRQKDGNLYASGMESVHSDVSGTVGRCKQCGRWIKTGSFGVIDSLNVVLLLPD